jgi:excisionase family DNA binding protein
MSDTPLLDAPPLLTVREVAAYLACAEETVKRLVRRGDLAATRVGARLRFRHADVAAYLEQRGRHPASQPLAAVLTTSGPARTAADVAVTTAELDDASVAADRTARLYRVSTALSTLQSPPEVAGIIVRESVAAFAAQAGAIYVPTDGGHALTALAYQGYDPAQASQYARLPATASSPITDAMSTRALIAIESPDDMLVRWPRLAGAQAHSGDAATIAAPLLVDDTLAGVLYLAFRAPRRFSADDRDFVIALARQCAQALDRARLYAEAQHAHQIAQQAAARTARLQLVIARLAAVQSPAEIAEVVVHQGIAALGAYAGALVLRDGESHSAFRTIAAEGYPGSLDRVWANLPLDAPTPIADAGRTGAPVWLESREAYAERYPHLATSLNPYTAAVAALPLVVDDQPIGALGLSFTAPQPFTPDERSYLEAFVQQCALALRRARLDEMVQQARVRAEEAAARITQLQAITAAFAEALTPEAASEVLLTHGIRVLGASGGGVGLRSRDGAQIELACSQGYPPGMVAAYRLIPLGTPVPYAEVVATGQPIWLESGSELVARYPHLAGAIAQLGNGALASIPLRVHDRTIGGLTLQFGAPRVFSAGDRSLMLALAQQCGQAYERARLYAEAQAQAARQTVLADAVRAFSAAQLDLEAVLNTIARCVVDAIGDLSAVGLISNDGQRLELAAIAHHNPEAQAVMAELLQTFPLSINEGLTSTVLRSGQAQLFPVLSAETLRAQIKPEHAPYLDQYGIDSLMIAPLRAHGQILGTLGALRDTPGQPYTEDDLAMLQELADRAALALDNARLYAAAQHAVQVREQFFSIAAHELKTPLTVIYGQTQLLQRRAARGDAIDDRAQRAFETIASQVTRLNTLIAGLLDASQLQRGQLAVERAPLELGALVRQVVEQIQPALDERHTLVMAVPNTPLWLMGDGQRLEQVLHNLIGNAIKYSPAGGAVRVELGQRGDRLCLAVRDQGIGIPAADIPRLFTRFYRASNVSERHISGFGMGLAIVHAIVTQHAGTVQVESAAGSGSTFTVDLPLLQQADPMPGQPRS